MVAELSYERQEVVLDWIRDHGMFDYYELRAQFNVHYVVARSWVNDLIKRGLVCEYPIRKGNRKVFMLDKREGAQDKVFPIQVAFDGKPHTIAEVTSLFAQSRNPYRNNINAQLAYLFLRSYWTNSTDAQQQALRGVHTPVEVRSRMMLVKSDLENLLTLVEDLLVNRVIWEEGLEFAQRFGALEEDQFNKLLAFAEAYRKSYGGA
jgi:hypothetical protein